MSVIMSAASHVVANLHSRRKNAIATTYIQAFDELFVDSHETDDRIIFCVSVHL